MKKIDINFYKMIVTKTLYDDGFTFSVLNNELIKFENNGIKNREYIETNLDKYFMTVYRNNLRINLMTYSHFMNKDEVLYHDEIEIDSQWMIDCWNIFSENHKIYLKIPQVKIRFELCIDKMSDAIKLIKENNYNEAINLLKTLEIYSDLNFYSDILYNLACCYSMLNDEENTFKYLNLAIEKDDSKIYQMQIDTDFDNFRQNPRFVKIIENENNKNIERDNQLFNNVNQLLLKSLDCIFNKNSK